RPSPKAAEVLRSTREAFVRYWEPQLSGAHTTELWIHAHAETVSNEAEAREALSALSPSGLASLTSPGAQPRSSFSFRDEVAIGRTFVLAGRVEEGASHL